MKRSLEDMIGISEEQLKSKDTGRVYIFKIEMPDTKDIVYKVGKASGHSSLDRFIQIMRSMYVKYQMMPKARIKRDRTSVVPFKDETSIHKLLQEYVYTPSKQFDGCTEFFMCDEEIVLQHYEDIIEQ